MTASFFRRVSRYPRGAAVDERENRVTEVTAAVLSYSTEIGRAAVAALAIWDRAYIEAIHTVRVSTQKFVSGEAGSGLVDLELEVFAGDDPLDPVRRCLWVEIKHGAGLSGDQIDTYVSAGAKEVEPPDIVLLAPRSSSIDIGDRPVVRRDWEDFADRFKSEVSSEADPTARWLLTQYFKFLREEQLMDDDRLTVESAYAMQNLSQVDSAVGSLVRRAIPKIEQGWGKRWNPEKKMGLGSWHHFDWAHKHTKYFLELMITPDSETPEPSGGYVFFAGLTYLGQRNNPFIDSADSSLLAPGYLDFRSQGCYRLMRKLKPEALLQADDPEAQSQLLADWTISAFEGIDAAFPARDLMG